MWTPIPLEELYDKILVAENEFFGEMSNFWELIKIYPEKWSEKDYGEEGGGFWVVAICGCRVIWYNDIEEGFNISKYSTFGAIGEYSCAQVSLNIAVQSLVDLIWFGGGEVLGQASPPINLD